MADELKKITYEDKVDYQVQGQDEKYCISAKDMNEIKHVFNNSTEAIQNALLKVQEAYGYLGDYKIENGLFYFKKADGTWGEGINLNVSVEEFENVARRVTNLETNGVAIGDTLPIGTIVYVEGDEKDLRTGYEKIDVFPPKQLLINNDFQVWQRGESFDYSNSVLSKNTYFPNMWAMGNGSKNFIISKDDNGCHLELKVANSYLDLRQCVFGLKAGDTVTMSMKITNSGESFTMLQRIGNDGTTNKNINVLKGEHIYNLTYTLKDTDIRSDGGFVIYPLLGYANKTFDIIINYVDLFEGDIVYPHIKEDYAIALIECQMVAREIEINQSGYVAGSTPVKGTINFCVEMDAIPSFVITSVGTRQNVASVGIEVNNKRLIYTITTSTAGYFTLDGYKLILSCEPL